MDRIKEFPNRKRWAIGVAVLFVVSLACNYSKNIPAEQETAHPPQATVVPTDTLVPTNTMEPTETASPTVVATPTVATKPTKSPTWMPYPTRTLRPTWTASPTLSPTVTPEISPILKEDFSDPMTPWLKKKGETFQMGIAGGKYFMKIFKPNVEITSSRSWLKLAEVRIEADVTFNDGDGYAGFSCRESTSSYYTLFITSDGHYGLGQTRNGRVDFMLYQKSKLIKTGKGSQNHIRGECRGNTITLFVNNQALAQKRVEGIGPGYVGMMAGTLDTSDNLTVYFDNLVIWGP